MSPSIRNDFWHRNPVLRLIATQAAFGAALGLGLAASLVALDAHGVGRLMRGSDAGLVAFALLAGGFMVTFGSLAAGGAVMLAGGGKGTERRGGFPKGATPAPVRVVAPRQRRR